MGQLVAHFLGTWHANDTLHRIRMYRKVYPETLKKQTLLTDKKASSWYPEWLNLLLKSFKNRKPARKRIRLPNLIMI